MSDRAMVNISGLSKESVLAALYNASRPQGMGFMHYDPTPMTEKVAEGVIKRMGGVLDFDYLAGRVMKVNIHKDEFDPWCYARDNGQGAAARVISELRVSGKLNTDAIAEQHKKGTKEAAAETRGMLEEESSFQSNEHGSVLRLGLAEFKNVLAPKVDRAL